MKRFSPTQLFNLIQVNEIKAGNLRSKNHKVCLLKIGIILTFLFIKGHNFMSKL